MVPPRTTTRRRRGHLDVRRGTLARPKKDNTLTDSSQEMANILLQQYESVFNKTCVSHKIKDMQTFFMETEGNPDYLNDITISKEEVEKVLSRLPCIVCSCFPPILITPLLLTLCSILTFQSFRM